MVYPFLRAQESCSPSTGVFGNARTLQDSSDYLVLFQRKVEAFQPLIYAKIWSTECSSLREDLQVQHVQSTLLRDRSRDGGSSVLSSSRFRRVRNLLFCPCLWPTIYHRSKILKYNTMNMNKTKTRSKKVCYLLINAMFVMSCQFENFLLLK